MLGQAQRSLMFIDIRVDVLSSSGLRHLVGSIRIGGMPTAAPLPPILFRNKPHKYNDCEKPGRTVFGGMPTAAPLPPILFRNKPHKYNDCEKPGHTVLNNPVMLSAPITPLPHPMQRLLHNAGGYLPPAVRTR